VTGRDAPAPDPVTPLPAAVLASGRGSNFQALTEHMARIRAGGGAPLWEVRLLVSDRESAGALDRAEAAGVSSQVIPAAGRPAEQVASEMLDAFRGMGIHLILLAGYLRLVPGPVVRAFRDRILNLHPALLPAFGGKGMYGRRVHEAVLASGARVSGATVHLVDERYDEGRILAQWPVPVRSSDDPDALAGRIHGVEHRLYPRVVDHVARFALRGERPEPLDFATFAESELDPP
jgi:phosphoribosylglycinamide formyltransferase 1